MELQLSPAKVNFNGYKNYTFSDPARRIDPAPMTLFDGSLDENGRASFSAKPADDWLVPGKLTAKFKARVFEKGGDFSERNQSFSADLYESYVGINIPKKPLGFSVYPTK